MTFLELCQRLAREVDASGSGPSAVTGQTGENRRIVDWVASAWQDIQLQRNDWNWMRGTFSFTTIADQDTYTAAQAGIASRCRAFDKEDIRIYTTATGVGDEMTLPFIPYEDWRYIYRVGTQTAQRPIACTIMPTNSLGLGPKPTAGYTVAGEYWKSAQTLAADADEPEMPAEFHMAIVYRAMMMYGRFTAAGEVFNDGEQNYRRILTALVRNQTPMVRMGGSLV